MFILRERLVLTQWIGSVHVCTSEGLVRLLPHRTQSGNRTTRGQRAEWNGNSIQNREMSMRRSVAYKKINRSIFATLGTRAVFAPVINRASQGAAFQEIYIAAIIRSVHWHRQTHSDYDLIEHLWLHELNINEGTRTL